MGFDGSGFLRARFRDLTPALKRVVGVENVWCDTRTEQSSQKFVLWAGYLLENAAAFEAALAGRRFSFSLLVHSDATSAMVDFLPSSSVLQVCGRAGRICCCTCRQADWLKHRPADQHVGADGMGLWVRACVR
jgi:hypothetical protein